MSPVHPSRDPSRVQLRMTTARVSQTSDDVETRREHRGPRDRRALGAYDRTVVVRILLLIPFLVWMVYASQPPAAANAPVDARLLTAFFAGVCALVVVMRVWSLRLARRVDGRSMRRSLRRFGLAMFVARIVVAAWFVVGLYWLSWGPLVLRTLVPPEDWPVMLPATVVAIAPAFLAW